MQNTPLASWCENNKNKTKTQRAATQPELHVLHVELKPPPACTHENGNSCISGLQAASGFEVSQSCGHPQPTLMGLVLMTWTFVLGQMPLARLTLSFLAKAGLISHLSQDFLLNTPATDETALATWLTLVASVSPSRWAVQGCLGPSPPWCTAGGSGRGVMLGEEQKGNIPGDASQHWGLVPGRVKDGSNENRGRLEGETRRASQCSQVLCLFPW